MLLKLIHKSNHIDERLNQVTEWVGYVKNIARLKNVNLAHYDALNDLSLGHLLDILHLESAKCQGIALM